MTKYVYTDCKPSKYRNHATNQRWAYWDRYRVYPSKGPTKGQGLLGPNHMAYVHIGDGALQATDENGPYAAVTVVWHSENTAAIAYAIQALGFVPHACSYRAGEAPFAWPHNNVCDCDAYFYSCAYGGAPFAVAIGDPTDGVVWYVAPHNRQRAFDLR